jgi:hypothetical protein
MRLLQERKILYGEIRINVSIAANTSIPEISP